MRARCAVLTAICCTSFGCVRVNHEVRVEKGPVLRAYEREVLAGESGVSAAVAVAWPKVTLSFARFDRCRQERVEEVVEETITESFAPSAGPAFTLGMLGVASGGALLGFRGSFSDQPNTRVIDETGHYGPSARTIATGWSVVLLSVGVPALVTGVVGLAQSGEHVDRRKVEQLASAMEHPCHEAPVDGEVELVRIKGEGPGSLRVATSGGKVTFTADQLSELRLASVRMNGALVLFPEEEAAKFEAFLSCSEAIPVPSPAGLSEMGEEALVARYNSARACGSVAGEVGEQAAAALGAEIQRRRAGRPGPTVREGPRPRSLEDARAMYRPTLVLAEGSRDVAALSDPESLAGTAAQIRGTLVQQVAENILVVKVGTAELLVFVPPDATFGVPPANGAELEAIGVVVGTQVLEEKARPLIRAAWIQ
ncbi:MAG: hypothetical protein IRZ16_22325 [Myxococcaceae bacterium]|nr:hypothetical protein [Myxococcaceae bacterium]